MFLILYKSLVRPHLEYGSCVWSTMYKMEKIKIENIQKRATKVLPELKHKSYTESLKSLGLPSLEYRRLKADMIQTYKIFKNIDRLVREKKLSNITTMFQQLEGIILKLLSHIVKQI